MTPRVLPVAVVLAAGRGTRMRSDLPKVLHEAAGRPMLDWVLETARQSGCERRVVVIGHRAAEVQSRFENESVDWVVQEEQLGTGHALAQVESAVDPEDLLLVLSGDVPLVQTRTLDRLCEAARRGWGAMVVADLETPGSLGRVVQSADGTLCRIVEAADASPLELDISMVNAGIYALPAGETFAALRELGTDNAQGELYLTDAVTSRVAAGRRIELVALEDPREALGVNTRRELAAVDEILMKRRLEEFQDQGVTMWSPATIRVGPRVEIGPDCVLFPSVLLEGATKIGRGCVVHQGGWIRDSEVGEGAEILPYSVLDQSQVGTDCSVGPFARLRPGTRLENRAKVGNFVEVKNSLLKEGAKASHLTYLGDATIGEEANIGAGVVTCNYDGAAKHRTEVGARAFIGSDTMLVAPVRVGAGATTAAGSVITKNVPEAELAVARSRQRNISGWNRPTKKPPKSSEE